MPSVRLHLEDPGAPSFAPYVVALLNATLPSDSTQTPAQAARALDSLCTREYGNEGDKSSVGGFIWWFWDLMHDLARQVPYDGPEQDRLVQVVKGLHDLPPRVVKLGEDWGADGGLVHLWTSLPQFGNTFYEGLPNDIRARGPKQRKEREVNIQAYAAKIMGLGLIPFKMYAIWAFVDALEGTMTHVRGGPNEINDDPTVVNDILQKIRVASNWMIHTAHVLYGRNEDIHGATHGPLWRKIVNERRNHVELPNGLHSQRWQLWKERFKVIRDTNSLDEEARQEARNAYLAMERAEQG